MRLIDAKALLDPENIHIMWPSIDHYYPSKYVVLVEDIKKAPTIDPVKHGRWIREVDYNTCSVCGKYVHVFNDDGDEQIFSYCPHCGARMDAGGGDTEADQ